MMKEDEIRDKITVVVLTHNRAEELCRTLTHLFALEQLPSIVIVDNCSVDITAKQIRSSFPKVTYIRAERNWGAAGRNIGVDFVKTPYVAFCDDDTWWGANSLNVAIEILDKHPDISVLNARILVGPDERLDPACADMENSSLDVIAGVGPQLTGFMAGANVMRTIAYQQANGYWDAFFIGGEETLLAMDIMDSGGKIVYAPAIVVHHWPSHLRNSTLRERLTIRNAIWTCWLRLPFHLAWQRTRKILSQTPDRRLRRRAIADVLLGCHKVMIKRRILRRQTCELLQRVWAQH
ncbi:hypothetical protein W822_05865 [Advenella kashmirensis W13003]|uniref:Glycosyltransferase 2-like domain-containing protein n=1 Tax=Advenella kashmirensis W13003 TaxID=1424334 RepID=V8QX72_9BURK|nr:glycosyltransferase [Advenella kashmirensis]ETF03604.1 hypothetical protein W822_05865 [Advenella kashmirensis W13003]